jgi:TonB family protein
LDEFLIAKKEDSSQMFRRTAIFAALFLGLAIFAVADSHREVRTKVQPVYPAIARQMGLQGTVKLEVIVAPGGSVRKTTVLGGNPVLANSAMQAVQQWRFEPAATETSELIEIHFSN